jgi:hypothetical protein
MSTETIELFVLSYCQRNLNVPGARDMSEFLLRKLGKSVDVPEAIHDAQSNSSLLDQGVIDRAEVYVADQATVYHLNVAHLTKPVTYDIYFELSSKEGNLVYYAYFLYGEIAYDFQIEKFISMLIKTSRTRLDTVKTEKEYLSNLRLVRGNGVVYDFSDFVDM